MERFLLTNKIKFLALFFFILVFGFSYSQPGGYAFRMESNSNFGTPYVLTNNSPTSGYLSATVQANSTAAK